MAKATSPPPDRAALSSRARDHLHELRTPFTRLDFLSMTVDLFIGFGAVLVLGGMCSLTAFKYLRREEWVPSALLGATNYEYATWLLFTFTAAIGMAGLAQFWFRRLWQKTYGTRAGLWTSLLGTQLLFGAVMPVACLLMLNSHNLLMTWHSAVFALTAATYLRHALQVYRWAR